jgi:hypothetical protein
MPYRKAVFWILQGPGWLLLAYLIVAQGVSALDYRLGVTMGTQESADVITEVGVAFWYGFAFGDLVIYIPLLAVGLIGQWFHRVWTDVVLIAALGITAYWPVVCLAAVVAARGSEGWLLSNETGYWLVLPVITMWGAWGLWQQCRKIQGRVSPIRQFTTSDS